MPGFTRFFKFIGWSLFTCLMGFFFLLSAFFLYLTPNLPPVSQLKDVQFQTPLRIYSEDGKLISEFGEKRRSPIHIENVPKHFIDAFVSAEDNRFYTHHGVDPKGLVRAVVQLATTGHIKSGGSTITMQVAKNFFLSREKTFTRKFNEILLALQIEQELSKSEIIELYFNKIYLGNRAYGIEAAAQVYYGKHINELTLPQMAMIAGLPKAPSRYNPIADKKRALERRNWILKRMFELGYITNSEYDLAIATPVTASYHGAMPELDAPYLAEMARKEIVNKYGQDAYTRGLIATLTVDSKLQAKAKEAVQKGLEAYDRRHGYRGPEQKVSASILSSESQMADFLGQIPTIAGQIPAIVTSVSETTASLYILDKGTVTLPIEHAKWARSYITVNARGPKVDNLKKLFQPGDLIRVRELNNQWYLTQIPDVQGALVSIRPDSGAVQALVGGYDFAQSKYNRAIQAQRQPGSNIKPFIYLSALNKGFTAASIFNDAPIVFEDTKLETAWRPENSGGKFAGPTRLRRALYTSRNLVSIRLLKATGIDTALKMLKKFGFDPDQLPHNLSLALGSAGLTPMQIATGYSIIANGGYPVSPYFIDKITTTSGDVLYQHPKTELCPVTCTTTESSSNPAADTSSDIKLTPIIDQREIYIMHSILKDVILKGTGRRAKVLHRSDLAGKTGTTNDQKDAWFSGFNQNLETTVWTGFDQPKTLGRHEFGATAALPIWIDYMQTALKNMPLSSMKRPNGIVSVRIDAKTGKRTYIGNPDAIFEIFRKEHVPDMEKKPENPNTSPNKNQDSAPVYEQLF
jgi:penicillin-binding protein 1A